MPSLAMCIVFVAMRAHPLYPLVVLANRDEFLDRPTAAMHVWEGDPTILAGKDLLSGGSWFGINDRGGLAVLTNFQEPGDRQHELTSRGELVTACLRGEQADFSAVLRASASNYAGFNLIYGDWRHLVHFSNRSGDFTELSSGVYGLSNALLDTPWPKVEKGKMLLRAALTKETLKKSQLFAILDDTRPADYAQLPQTGLPVAVEHRLSSIRIPPGERYGSRSATVLLVDHQWQARIWEKNYLDGSIRSFELTPSESFRLYR